MDARPHLLLADLAVGPGRRCEGDDDDLLRGGTDADGDLPNRFERRKHEVVPSRLEVERRGEEILLKELGGRDSLRVEVVVKDGCWHADRDNSTIATHYDDLGGVRARDAFEEGSGAALEESLDDWLQAESRVLILLLVVGLAILFAIRDDLLVTRVTHSPSSLQCLDCLQHRRDLLHPNPAPDAEDRTQVTSRRRLASVVGAVEQALDRLADVGESAKADEFLKLRDERLRRGRLDRAKLLDGAKSGRLVQELDDLEVRGRGGVADPARDVPVRRRNRASDVAPRFGDERCGLRRGDGRARVRGVTEGEEVREVGGTALDSLPRCLEEQLSRQGSERLITSGHDRLEGGRKHRHDLASVSESRCLVSLEQSLRLVSRRGTLVVRIGRHWRVEEREAVHRGGSRSRSGRSRGCARTAGCAGGRGGNCSQSRDRTGGRARSRGAA